MVSEARQSDGLAVRLAGRERAKWRHIGAGIVLLRYSTGWLMRRFSHRGLSFKNNNSKRWKKKTDLITISARKNSHEWPVLNQIGQLHPWGVVQNRGRSVGTKHRRKGRWREKKQQ